jgi:hypothetical protein
MLSLLFVDNGQWKASRETGNECKKVSGEEEGERLEVLKKFWGTTICVFVVHLHLRGIDFSILALADSGCARRCREWNTQDRSLWWPPEK